MENGIKKKLKDIKKKDRDKEREKEREKMMANEIRFSSLCMVY